MGSYFSLHDAAFWEQTIAEGPEPSIWSNVNFSPLALHQRILLERPGRVTFSFSSGLRQGGTSVQISESAEVSLLVGFEEAAGRLYSAILFKAAESSPHRYGRELEEVVLARPGATQSAPISPTSTNGRIVDMTRRPAAARHYPLEMDKLGQEDPMQETGWQYLLMYSVKEGVLLFFSNDIAECENVVREVALSFGEKSQSPEEMNGGRSNGVRAGPGTVAAANLAAALKVKCIEHPIGRAPVGATSLLTALIVSDLRRQFAVRCSPEEQPECTNCVVFVLRAMMAMQLAVRGYDIRTICISPEYKNVLGSKAGDAACNAWEQLWRTARA